MSRVPSRDSTETLVEELASALAVMVNLFDHCGLNGLMLSAENAGWTKEMVQERMAACAQAKKIIALVDSRETNPR